MCDGIYGRVSATRNCYSEFVLRSAKWLITQHWPTDRATVKALDEKVQVVASEKYSTFATC